MALDRFSGAEWLRRYIQSRIVVANCHQQLSYSGGIMADCMVGETNLNRAALMAGHVISVVKMGGGGPPLAAGPRFPPSNHYHSISGGASPHWDLDYTAYNGKVSGPRDGPPVVANGRAGLRPLMEGGKSPSVKKLEKIINDDKKTINQLKKTTNLDAGI